MPTYEKRKENCKYKSYIVIAWEDGKHVKRELAEGVSGFVMDLSEGIRFILNNKVIRKLSIFFLVIYTLIQPIFAVVLPLFFRTWLEFTDTQYGYLQMVIVLGALVGSILVGVLFNKENEVTKSLVIGCSLLMATMMYIGLYWQLPY
ncbi:MAG: Vacuole effluxer Atg22 like protein [Pelotomaculum sp. PtaB.Bin013]|uniref:MFS transporter n=1 Tax=Pelotomaculum isophthalicicum JI TaxID=947010 RepID=A0A9X4H7U3_9FIRM|nr:hypothetical protein [Pelotomaculum isophthalicicum]MDF9407999.1 hypothetical protein [Pelotomaculum isophthalicicum JI]OPX83146.1 MAG: Vacuole effluxer Atg22 like protein [Pelotomaculum sp. PtaB.Bin013]